MTELERAAADVIIAGYVFLILALTWLSVTYKSRRKSYEDGYRHGFEKGERLGYEKYGEEVQAAWKPGVRAAQHAARTRHELTPRADWGPQPGQ